MKKYVTILISIVLMGYSCSVEAKSCDEGLIIKLLQDILDNSNLILPKTTDIQNRIGNCTVDDAAILSQLDAVSDCCDANSSQLDVVESLVEDIMVSSSDGLIRSQLDVIESVVDSNATCCTSNSSQLDVIESVVDSNAACCASSSDVLGELIDIGSCLDSAIDVPTDINNLQLTIISLLKTILLDLRGCNIP